MRSRLTRAHPPFNTARTHTQTTPRLMPCISMEELTMLSSSCEFDRHIVMLSSCYHHLVSSTCISACYHNETSTKVGITHAPLTRLARTPRQTTTDAMHFYGRTHHAIIILWVRQTHRHAIIILWAQLTLLQWRIAMLSSSYVLDWHG